MIFLSLGWEGPIALSQWQNWHLGLFVGLPVPNSTLCLKAQVKDETGKCCPNDKYEGLVREQIFAASRHKYFDTVTLLNKEVSPSLFVSLVWVVVDPR